MPKPSVAGRSREVQWHRTVFVVGWSNATIEVSSRGMPKTSARTGLPHISLKAYAKSSLHTCGCLLASIWRVAVYALVTNKTGFVSMRSLSDSVQL